MKINIILLNHNGAKIILAKAKKPIKKSKAPESTAFPSGLSWHSSWDNLDRAIQNFRKDMEHVFERPFSFQPSFPMSTSFPEFPKMPETTCDVVDEGNQLRVKMNVPGVKKNEISLNVTDNSLEISAKHRVLRGEEKELSPKGKKRGLVL